MKRPLLLAMIALAAGCATPYAQGQSAMRQGRFVEAEGYFSQALTEDPGRADALVGLGIAQYKQGQVDQSIESLQKAGVLRIAKVVGENHHQDTKAPRKNCRSPRSDGGAFCLGDLVV